MKKISYCKEKDRFGKKKQDDGMRTGREKKKKKKKSQSGMESKTRRRGTHVFALARVHVSHL